jgi:hypothetical protein
MFLAFILLNLNNICLGYSFKKIHEKILKNDICQIDYNPSKTAAIVNIDCGSAFYVNFKTQTVRRLVKHWPNVFPTWVSDDIANIQGPCGTGCSQSIIFVAPTTSIACPIHEYRIESLSQDEPPDFYNNDPLLIEPHKKIYVCYDETDVIHIFRMPKKLLATIYPPRGYYADGATLHNHDLVITYKDAKEKIKKIIYQKIQ